jgi:hypothetical protein
MMLAIPVDIVTEIGDSLRIACSNSEAVKILARLRHFSFGITGLQIQYVLGRDRCLGLRSKGER